MVKNVLIRNVRIFDAATHAYTAPSDIAICNGIITAIAPNLPAQPGTEIVEGNNLCASTGWTDCHTHPNGFDPFLSYPALGVTRIHDAGSTGAYCYQEYHEAISRLPFPITTYLYVGCWGVVGNGHDELLNLDNLKAEPFCEVAAQYPEEIIGAKIRIDPRVNCDTKKSLRMAKDLAVKAGLPLVVHPSRCPDALEDVLDVMEKDDVYAHTYSPVAPSLFDENGRVKQCAWEAMKRGVRFDLSHGSNNFNYALARQAIAQGFVVETISTDLHTKNYNRPGIDLAGVMTKAIQAGIPVEDALEKVILAPQKLLHVPEKEPTLRVGQTADITVYTVTEEPIELPDSQGNVERCAIRVEDVATIYGSTVNRSIACAVLSDAWWER